MYKSLVKPLIDFIVALLGILILSPFLIIVGILLMLQNKRTPFFMQTRPGKDQKAFQIIKFKTMSDEKDDKGNLLPDSRRITGFGKIIRKLSIDRITNELLTFIGAKSEHKE